jgi:hypothetical protein
MIAEILIKIDSCKTYEQVQNYREWLDKVEISEDEKRDAIGAIKLKLKQLADTGWAKITNENRFPADDEQRD